MKKEYVKIIVFAIQSVITVAVIVLACIFGIPCEHKETEWVVTEATCEDWGERQLVCQGKCGAVLESERLAPLGHDYGRYKTTKQPTCTENGSKERVCDRKGCGDVDVVVLKKTGHNEEPAVTENYVAPTCTENGGYDNVIYCSVCEAKVKSTKVVLDALGHTEAEPVVENYLNATCDFDGSYDAVVYCSTCNEELDRQPTVIHTSGHNIVISIYGKTMEYYCSECDVASKGSKGLEYTISKDNTCTVSGIGSCTDEYVFIPAYYLGKEVVGIADGAFEGASVRYVGIARTIKTIGNKAFADCKLLDNVVLPVALEKIGESAFSNCYSLKNITFDKNVIEIGDSAFEGCIALESVELPGGVKTIGKSAFKNTALESIVIPNGVTEIADSTFHGCTFLSEVMIGKSVTAIGNSAFFGCESLKSIVLPAGVTAIGDQAFAYCKSLVAIDLPGAVVSVGKYAFSECIYLERVSLPATLDTLGTEAFYRCTSLELIEFGGTLEQWNGIAVDLGYNYGSYNVIFGAAE